MKNICATQFMTALLPMLVATLLVASEAGAILKPAPGASSPLTNDPLLIYQWSLANNGQVVVTDLDDTHPISISGNSKTQIGWKNYDTLMKKEMVVAVLDSGLDSSHPELKDRFLPGFNFTVTDPKKEKIFDDDLGHGTHIAGIIAAISGNSDGIAGLSNKIKILPLKVYDSKEDTGAASKRKSIADRVAQAVEMAIERKADVINLSLGWPRVANSPAVEAVFKKALDAGILIVAAAGNDHHQAQIFPCAYRGVVCVGAVDINGALSNFSNFGGHVDLVAPGQEILSLWPELKGSSNFGIKGYELKSGTSQAAPFVSGALAILKSIFPNESSQQLRARILLGTESLPTQTLFGLLNIEKSIAADPRNFAAPIFKGVEMVEVDPRTLEFTLPLSVEFRAHRPSVRVSAETPGVTLSQPQGVSSSASQAEYTIRGRISELGLDNRLQYTVTVDGRPFTHQVLLAVKLGLMNPLKVSFPRSDLIRTQDLKSVPDPRHSPVVRYWATQKQGEQLKLFVWTLNGTQLEEKSVLLDQVSELQTGFGIVAEDWNLDGQTDYLVSALSRDEKGGAKEISLIYLDSELRVQHRFPLKYEGVLPTFQSVQELMVGRITVPGLGAMKVPMFWDTGLIPEKDLNPNAFAFEKNASAKRLYYFEPEIVGGSTRMVTRTLTAGMLDQQLRTRLNLDATQDISGIGTKSQSLVDLREGTVDMILSVGRGVNVALYDLKFGDLNQPFQNVTLQQLQRPGFDFSKNQTKETLNVSSPQLDSETDFEAIFSPTAARSVLLRGQQFGGNRLTLPSRGEQIIGLIKSYTKGTSMATFFETTEWLRVQGTWNSATLDAKAPVYRSSFLPGSLFTQLFVPVVVSADRNPGVFFDNSQLFSSSAMVYSVENNGQLSSTVGRSFSLPNNCVGRAPVLNSNGFTRLVFLCDEGGGFQLNFVDLR